MLVRSILLDIGKLLDGSFALGGATSVQTHVAPRDQIAGSHAAAVSDLAIDSQRRKPTWWRPRRQTST
jgi:hypothetical protein